MLKYKNVVIIYIGERWNVNASSSLKYSKPVSISVQEQKDINMVNKTVLENHIKQLENIIDKMKKNADNIEFIETNHSEPMKHSHLGTATYIGEQEFNFKVKFLFSTNFGL